MSEKKEFEKTGMVVKYPSPKAPSFVKAILCINVEQLRSYLDTIPTNNQGWVHFQIKESQGGKLYIMKDDYKAPEKQSGGERWSRPAPAPAPEPDPINSEEDAPF